MTENPVRCSERWCVRMLRMESMDRDRESCEVF